MAAVFSYVVLGAGFFTTQKSQQIIHEGVSQAASNLDVRGNIYLGYPDDVNQVIIFDIGLAAGGEPVDIDKLHITMSTPNSTPERIAPTIFGDLYPAPGHWSLYERHPDTMTNNLLKEGQSVTLHVTPPSDMPLTARSQFTLEVQPEIGAPLSIERKLPADINKNISVY